MARALLPPRAAATRSPAEGESLSDSTYVAVSAALAQLNELEIVANNLANADTAGFKRDRPIFTTALESALRTVEGELRPTASPISRTDGG